MLKHRKRTEFMQSLIEIKDASILVVVAHPDDETLWFYQSLQILKSQNEITIFCLTHSAESVRGKELIQLSQNIGIQVEFGQCKDTGINCLLNNVEVMHAFHAAFSRNRYDLVITHPPHGGEKPHPHHIQSYVATKKMCKSYNVGFGFFCETKLLDIAMPSNVFRLSGDTKQFILLRLIKACQLLKKEKLQITYVVKFSFSVLFNFN